MPTSPRCRRSPTPRRGRNWGGGMSEVLPISTQSGNPTFHVSYRIKHYVELEELYRDIQLFSNRVRKHDAGIINLVTQSYAKVTQIDDDKSEVEYYIELYIAQDVDDYLAALDCHLLTYHRYYIYGTLKIQPVAWSPTESTLPLCVSADMEE
jgi:hypothetical protein